MVIPTYNNRKIIGECLTSIFKQEIAPDEFEVIVADGGSSDDTRKIAATLGARIVHNPLRSGEAGKAAGLRVLSTRISSGQSLSSSHTDAKIQLSRVISL